MGAPSPFPFPLAAAPSCDAVYCVTFLLSLNALICNVERRRPVWGVRQYLSCCGLHRELMVMCLLVVCLTNQVFVKSFDASDIKANFVYIRNVFFSSSREHHMLPLFDKADICIRRQIG
ncbi:MAG: hypothetical protein ACKESB_03505 [Candidatus Hodgkinia cicadicola]